MNYIACVLQGAWPVRGNLTLGETYVQALHELCQRHMPHPATFPWRFVCFTDREVIPGVPTRPVPSGYTGWFNKIYLFSREAFPAGSRVLYMDLDTVPVKDIRPLLEFPPGELKALRNVWGPQDPESSFASGIMGWDVDERYHPWWERFTKFCGRRQTGTDEAWLKQQMAQDGLSWRAWQDYLPGEIFSYKAHIMGFSAGLLAKQPFTPEDARRARVIYFHGNPRPHEVNQKWNLVYHRHHGQ